jgi:hypothetical protein
MWLFFPIPNFCSGKSESMSMEQMLKKIKAMEGELGEMKGKVRMIHWRIIPYTPML